VAAAFSAAGGVAGASALVGASGAVSAFASAAGVATASVLVGSVAGSTIGAAAGVATVSALAGEAVAVSAFDAAPGAAVAGTLAGSPPATGEALTGAVGAGPPKKRRRSLLTEDPEVFEPAPIVKAIVQAVEMRRDEAPAPVPPAQSSAPPKIAEAIRALKRELPRAPILRAAPIAQIIEQIKAAPLADDFTEDEYAYAAAALLAFWD